MSRKLLQQRLCAFFATKRRTTIRLIAWVLFLNILAGNISTTLAATTLLVNTESFDTIDAGAGTNIELRFGNSTRTLLYDVTLSAFVFNNNVYVRGTLSGTNIFSNKSITGAHLNTSSTFAGAGLTNCTGSANKLTWLAATKQFACETDQTGGSSGGLSYAAAEGIFVNQGGDTMTGGLVINLSSGNLGLNVKQVISGSSLVISRNASVTGSLVVFGNTVIGKTSAAKAKLEVTGMMSGSMLTVSRNASVTGSLTVKGTTRFNGVQYTWPSSDGAAGTCLSTNGAGVLSWTTCGALAP